MGRDFLPAALPVGEPPYPAAAFSKAIVCEQLIYYRDYLRPDALVRNALQTALEQG